MKEVSIEIVFDFQKITKLKKNDYSILSYLADHFPEYWFSWRIDCLIPFNEINE